LLLRFAVMQVGLPEAEFGKSWAEYHPVENGAEVRRTATACQPGGLAPATTTWFKVDRSPPEPTHRDVFVTWDSAAAALQCTCREYGNRLLCRHIWCVIFNRIGEEGTLDLMDASSVTIAREYLRLIGRTAWVGQSFAARDSEALRVPVVARCVPICRCWCD